jgi:hypothetical protein
MESSGALFMGGLFGWTMRDKNAPHFPCSRAVSFAAGGLPQYQMVKSMGEGLVMYLQADRVRLLSIPVKQAKSVVKHIGIGSGEMLRGKDLTPPAGSLRRPPSGPEAIKS